MHVLCTRWFTRCLLAAAALLVHPLLCRGQEPAAAGSVETSLRYVPEDAIAFAHLASGDLSRDPMFEMYPTEIMSAAGKEELGFDPLLIESIDVAAGMPNVFGPAFVAVVHLREPVAVEQLSDKVLGAGEPREEDGRMFYPTAAPGIFLHQVDERTYLVGSDAYLTSALSGEQGDSKLKSLVRLGAKRQPTFLLAIDAEPLRPIVQGFLEQGRPNIPPSIYPHLETLAASVNQLAVMQATTGESSLIQLALVQSGPDEARQVAESLRGLVDSGSQLVIASIREGDAPSEAIHEASIAYAERMTKLVREKLDPRQNGKNVTIQVQAESAASVGTVGVVAGLLLPAVQQAREAARRVAANSNLRQVGLAIMTYEEKHRKMPRDITDPATGQPLLSWRVAILPFIDEQALYDRFHLDEPWDSPHNRQLLDEMPQVYQHPSSPQGSQTRFVMPVGEGLGIGGASGADIEGITDGASNTIMVVEAPDVAAVPWTSPQDVEIDLADPLANFRSAALGFNVLFGDGRTMFLDASIDPEIFKALLTHAGGETIPAF